MDACSFLTCAPVVFDGRFTGGIVLILTHMLKRTTAERVVVARDRRYLLILRLPRQHLVRELHQLNLCPSVLRRVLAFSDCVVALLS